MAVAVSATGTAVYNGTGAATQNFTFTTGPNASDTLALFFVAMDIGANQTLTSATWDSGGTNQACTLIGSKGCPTASNGTIYIYGVVNPTSGNKTLAVVSGGNWTGSAEMQSYTGTISSGVAAACTNFLSANGTSSGAHGTAAQTGVTGDMYVSAYVTNNTSAVSDTSIFLLSPAGNDSAANRFPSVGATHALTATIVGTIDWAAGSLDVVAAGSAVTNFGFQQFTGPVYRRPWHAQEQQFLAFVKAAPFAETITESRWHQPWSEPVRVKPALNAHLQQFQPYEETARFPEIVSEDRWHQPWSEPSVKSKVGLPAAEQQFLAAQPNPVISIPWFNWLSEPVRTKPGLAAQEHQSLAYIGATPFPETLTEDRWHQPWSEPVRQKIGIAATEHPLVSFDPFPFVSFSWFNALSEPVRQALRLITGANPDEFFSESARFPEIVSEDRWHQPWSEPVRRATIAALQSTTTFTAVVTTTPTASVDGWAPPWSEPPKPKSGLAVSQQQALALAEAAPFPETISEDRWHEPWAEPVRTMAALPASEQQAAAFVAIVAAAVPPVDGWASPFVEVPKSRQITTRHDALSFVALPPTAIVIEDWPDLVGAKSGLSAGGQQASAFVPVITTSIPSIDGWGSPFAEIPKPKAGTTAACQQFFAFDPAVFVATPDAWAQPWSDPPKPKVGINVAAQQALCFDPAVFVPSIDGWQNALAEPVRVQPRLTSDAIFFPPNFSTAAVPSFGYFTPFSEPQRQLAGLAARFQQIDAEGFVPIVPPFVFFFGNEEPLPWPGFRGNQFIRENYDSFVLPPFPIPNPPQTQAKFTVSGPSVSDLFPVSGVVYPYAPETRKTVP